MAGAAVVRPLLPAATTTRGSRRTGRRKGTSETRLGVVVRGTGLGLLVLFACAQAERREGAREQGEEGGRGVVHGGRGGRRRQGAHVRRPRLHRCKGLIHVLESVICTR